MENSLDTFFEAHPDIDISRLTDKLQYAIKTKVNRNKSRTLISKILTEWKFVSKRASIEDKTTCDLDLFLEKIGPDVKYISPYFLTKIKNIYHRENQTRLIAQLETSIHYNRKRDPTLKERQCSKCLETKSIAEFHTDNSNSFGTNSICKECKIRLYGDSNWS